MVKAPHQVAKDVSRRIRSIAKKPPKGVKEPSLDDDMNRVKADSLQDIVEILTEEPHKILPCLSMIRSPMFGVTRAQAAEKMGNSSEPWPDSYTQFKLIPKYWLWSWIQGVQKKFTPQIIELVESADKQAIRKLMLFATGRCDSSKVPPMCLDKVILSRTLLAAYKDMGSRLNDEWFGNAIMTSGEIDWQRHGAYSLQSESNEGSLATHVAHVSGTKASST
jgi:hypothetical protein